MKKTLILTILLLSFASLALAQGGFQSDTASSNAQGGFKGPGLDIISVKQAKEMPDDTNVRVEGKITKQIKKEKYMFEDSTGSIVVEIDDDKWRGLVVETKDTIILWGEIDQDFRGVELEVDRIEKK